MPKPLEFLGSSRNDLREFPAAVRLAIGRELLNVQEGLMPTDFKPMPTVGKGVYEIRVHVEGAWRAMYVAKFEEAVVCAARFPEEDTANAKG